MKFLDFIFRRGDPSNSWVRADGVKIVIDLDKPALNGIELGVPIDRLSFLGRSSVAENAMLSYHDLGIEICHSESEFDWFSVVFEDKRRPFRAFAGELRWKGQLLNIAELRVEDLKQVIGEWYWLDTDESETIVFYEYPTYEMQIEFALTGSIRRFNLDHFPMMADAGFREDYNCTKSWPPAFDH